MLITFLLIGCSSGNSRKSVKLPYVLFEGDEKIVDETKKEFNSFVQIEEVIYRKFTAEEMRFFNQMEDNHISTDLNEDYRLIEINFGDVTMLDSLNISTTTDAIRPDLKFIVDFEKGDEDLVMDVDYFSQYEFFEEEDLLSFNNVIGTVLKNFTIKFKVFESDRFFNNRKNEVTVLINDKIHLPVKNEVSK